jgi:DNA-binding NtrC family response regulator
MHSAATGSALARTMIAPETEVLDEYPTAGSILVVGSSPTDPDVVRAADALRPLADTTVTSAEAALELLGRLDVDLIVADESLDVQGGHDFLARAVALRPAAVPLLLARAGPRPVPKNGNNLAVLPKPVDDQVLRALAALALRMAALQRAVHELESGNHRLPPLDLLVSADALLEPDELESYEGIRTRSPGMRAVLHMLREIEESDVTVLLHGETGTGKELVARAIHARSRRHHGPFVAVNLGSVSDQLKESELFGHVRGAYTGASESRGGLFVEANRGTIFLDEIGEASPALQVALLRVLEEGMITPVGADRPRPVDVRIVSATNRDLEVLVREGRFRRDLYYRLNVFPISLPALRERLEDIFPLASHFLAVASRELTRKPSGISREARIVLEAYPWEGNVRELRNVMERAAILCRGGLIVAADLPITWGAGNGAGNGPAIPPGGATLRDLEREIFVKTLALADGNQSRAARILGLHESTFRFRLRKLGLATRSPIS